MTTTTQLCSRAMFQNVQAQLQATIRLKNEYAKTDFSTCTFGLQVSLTTRRRFFAEAMMQIALFLKGEKMQLVPLKRLASLHKRQIFKLNKEGRLPHLKILNGIVKLLTLQRKVQTSTR